MKKNKILMVIAHDNFRDEEFLIPKSIFEKNGYEIDIVSDKAGIARGNLGHRVSVTKTLGEIFSIDNYCCISIAGGGGSRLYLWNNKDLNRLIVDFNNKNKIIGAICISPVILENAGILKNKKVTFYKDDEETFEIMLHSSLIIKNEDVVVDGNIITANGPNASEKYGYTILKVIEEM